MLVGIGLDLVENERIRDALRRGGRRFVERVFTPSEREYAESHADAVPHFAARFAAKEALFKALGTGWGGGVSWREVEVRLDSLGRPSLALTGRTAEVARGVGAGNIHLSLTHIDQLSGAVVVLERGTGA